MIRELINDLRIYFNKIENPTEEEKRFIQLLNEGYFPITSVHRNDLESKGFDVKRISDSDMEELADKMADDYCEQLYWESLEIIAEILGFPKCGDNLDDNDDEDDIITPPTPSKGGKAKKVDPFVEFAGGDAEMAEALSGFEEMRKKMRKPMTDRAKTLLLAKLEKLSPDRAGQIALLDEATAKNWLSVYDGSDYNRVSHAPPGSKGDEWDRLIASYGGYDGGGEIIDITEHG